MHFRFVLFAVVLLSPMSTQAVAEPTTLDLRHYTKISTYADFSPAVSAASDRHYVYMDVEDTYLSQANPDANFGRSEKLLIENAATDSILIAFEQLYRAITVGSEITNVELILTPTGTFDANATVEVRRVTLPWRDGGGNGKRQVGAASYNDRFAAEKKFNRAWTSPGGRGDVVLESSFSDRLRNCWDEKRQAFVFSSAGLTADVAYWQDKRYRNYGWMITLANSKTERRLSVFASDEFEESKRPLLRVTFEPKPIVKPKKPDLDVTFIERVPRYYRYNDNGKTTYDRMPFRGDQPGIMKNPDYADVKKHPEPGDLVVFIAHIKNASDTPYSGTLSYRWKINDETVKERTAESVHWTNGQPQQITLDPWEETTTRLEWKWDVDLADPRKVVLEFEVDPENAVEEITENNNCITKYVAGKTLKYWVEQSLYDYVKDYVTNWGSYSFEDYLQWHCDVWNETYFCKSRFDDFAPDGCVLRMSLDDFEIVPDGYLAGGIHRPEDSLDPRFDGEWGSTWLNIREENPTEDQLRGYHWFMQQHRVVLEPSLLHEGSHQIWGAYDIYWSNIEYSTPTKPTGKCKVKDETGHYITRGNFYLFPGLMGGDDTRPNSKYNMNTGLYSANSVGGANTNAPYRNGFFGEWQYDLPEKCFVKITSRDGVPLAGAKVTIWQQTWQGIINDNQVAEDLVVGPDGVLQLPNQDSGEPKDYTTITGHTFRKATPWGRIDVVGQNITLMLQIDYHGQRDYQFARATTFNRPYWNGHTDAWTEPMPCRISPAIDLNLSKNVALGAKAKTAKNSQQASNLVDGDVTTRWRAGKAEVGDFIEIELPKAVDVGVIRIVQDGTDGNQFFQRFTITTQASDNAKPEAFDAQSPIHFGYAAAFEKDTNNDRESERWVTYAAQPRMTKVIRIEATDVGGTDVSEIRVFATE